MPIVHKLRALITGKIAGTLLLLPPALVPGQPASRATSSSDSTQEAIHRAQRQVTAYLTELADLHCAETVIQDKLSPNGHVEASERAKYDYLIMISGSGDEFQMNESRIESSTSRGKPAQLPMLVTNGIATILLVFHPYYQDSFKFDIGNDETMDGRLATPVAFTHVAGRRSPAALALRGREYPLELQGTAWLDKQSGEVLKVDASLQREMSDVGLSSLRIHVEYKPTELSRNSRPLMLPTLAVVEVTTPRQHWRNTHIFEEYKSFSADAEQISSVKVHPDDAGAAATDPPRAVSPNAKEKP
jgi:hypothetical protein